MSIDHSIELDGDEKYTGKLNIVGADTDIASAESLHGALFSFEKSDGSPGFTYKFSLADLRKIYAHLSQYSVLTSESNSHTGRFVEVKPGLEEMSAIFENADSEALVTAVQNLVSNRFTPEDTATILGRKDGLQRYKDMLEHGQHSELEWQTFFSENEWIFGYGLRYKYLGILQREAHVSSTDLAGGQSVVSDFLLADKSFTKLVEIKRPDTPLFGRRQNRSDAWTLSSNLMDAVSQILAQKANWEIEGVDTNYDGEGNVIEQGVADADSILIIGSLESVEGSDQEQAIKRKTFELFRRNLRNVEVLSYDELYERAKYIVTETAKV